MQLRRSKGLTLAAEDIAEFDLDNLLAGGSGVRGRVQWRARVPHRPDPVDVDAADLALLQRFRSDDWHVADVRGNTGDAPRLRRLLRAGLLVPRRREGGDEARYRALHWDDAAAAYHRHARWHGRDAAGDAQAAGLRTATGLVDRHGPPPPAGRTAVDAACLPLPQPTRDAFDDLLDARSTCRNFDVDAWLPLPLVSQLLHRVFGARGRVQATAGAAGLALLKRTSPSGGGLHPTECWLIVQRVQGVAPGLYRYDVDTHSLQWVTPGIAPPPADANATEALAGGDASAWQARHWRAFARIAVAGQNWFADAPLLCVLAPRFARSHWKYREHPKAYRVAILDVGHLSQTLQLCATQAGLGAFVTAAINEVDLERAFGLEAMVESPLAICGVGPRAATRTQPELDPNGRAWPRR